MNFIPIIFHPVYGFIKKDDENKFISKNGFLKKNLENIGLLSNKNLYCPNPIDKKSILNIHSNSYVYKVFNNELTRKELRVIGLKPFSFFKERSVISAGGTFLSSKLALKNGIAFNLAGGSHHAFESYGAGFCIFNDVAIAVRKLLLSKKIKKALILDLDVHQGDGNAKIFSNDNNVFTVSLHCNDNYPFSKSKSDLDIGFKKGTGDTEYLYKLDKTLEKLQKIDFDIIFYIAGVDVHYKDKLGLLKITEEGIFRREKRIINFVKKRNIPLVVTLGGGYNDNLKFLADLHTFIFKSI